MLQTHQWIPTENEMTSVIMIHRGNFAIKNSFINNPSSAEIENLANQSKSAINQT